MPSITDNAAHIPAEHVHHKWLFAFTEPVMTVIRSEPYASMLSEDARRSICSLLFKRLETIAEPVLTSLLSDEINIGLKTPVPNITLVPATELEAASARLLQRMQASDANHPDAIFPLLRPKLEQAAEYYAEAVTEMLQRINEHENEISRALLKSPELGIITYIGSVDSDPHRHRAPHPHITPGWAVFAPY